MSLREQRERLLLEIETAASRCRWAEAEAKIKGGTPLLTKFMEDSREERRSLQTKLAKLDVAEKPDK